jgi:hypothetical protein
MGFYYTKTTAIGLNEIPFFFWKDPVGLKPILE